MHKVVFVGRVRDVWCLGPLDTFEGGRNRA